MAVWLAWLLTPLPSKVSTWNNKISHCVGEKPEPGYLKVNLNKWRQKIFLGLVECFFLCLTVELLGSWQLIFKGLFSLLPHVRMLAQQRKSVKNKIQIRSKGKNECLTKDLAFVLFWRILPWLCRCNQAYVWAPNHTLWLTSELSPHSCWLEYGKAKGMAWRQAKETSYSV